MIGRGGRSRTGTGNDAQRGLSPPCLHSNHAAIKWCGQRESHPHELALTGFSLRRVYCFATSAKKLEHPQGRAPCCLSYQDSPSLSAGWMQSGRSGRTRTRIARLRGGSPELLRGRGADVARRSRAEMGSPQGWGNAPSASEPNWSARQDSHLHGLSPASF